MPPDSAEAGSDGAPPGRAGEMPVKRNAMPAPLERSNQRLNLYCIQEVVVVIGLVGDDDMKVGKGLPEQTGEDHG